MMKKRLINFTLIELLVVVSIIAILAALLLPALAKARDKAKSGKCTAQLKQMGVLVMYYHDDYDSWIVPADQKNPTDSNIINSLNVGPDMFWAESLGAYYLKSEALYRQVFTCPAMPGPFGKNLDGYQYTHYGICPYVSGSITGSFGIGGTYAVGPVKMAKYKRPSELILLADSDRGQVGYVLSYISFFYPRHNVFYANSLYLGGHVAPIKAASVTNAMIGK